MSEVPPTLEWIPCAKGFAHDLNRRKHRQGGLPPTAAAHSKTSQLVVVVMKTSTFKKLAWAIMLAAVALIPGSRSDAGDPPKKVTLCHKGKTLEVAEPAVQAHLNHGDTLGPCQVTPGENR